MLDDNVGAFSELSQNHVELAITRDLAAKAKGPKKKLQVLVDDGILVLPLKVCQGDVQTVVFHYIQVVHRWVAIRSLHGDHGEVEMVKKALRCLTGEG